MNKTWRNILPGILFMVACTSLAQAQTIDVTKPIIGKLTAVGDGWSPIEIVDVAQAPLDEHPRFRTKSKTIFKGPEVGALKIVRESRFRSGRTGGICCSRLSDKCPFTGKFRILFSSILRSSSPWHGVG